MTQVIEKEMTLSKESSRELTTQLKKQLGGDIRVEDVVRRVEGTWEVNIYHEIPISEEENKQKSIQRVKIRDGDHIPYREEKETVQLNISPAAECVWLIEAAKDESELPDLDSLPEAEQEVRKIYEKQLEGFKSFPILQEGEDEPEETPYRIQLSGDGGTLIVLDKKEVCPDCGRFSISQRMTYVWHGTKDPDLLELGYGASVKHYWTECSHCSYGMYG